MSKVLMSMTLAGITLGCATIFGSTSEVALAAATAMAQDQGQESHPSTPSPKAAAKATQSLSAGQSTFSKSELKKLPFCDAVKEAEMPRDENGQYVCRARNVWKPIPQTKEEEKKTFLPSKEGKKVIDQEAYDRWNSIKAPVLSRDGQWVAYSLVSPAGAGELVIRATRENREFRVARGSIGRPATEAQHAAQILDPIGERNTEFTLDSRFVVFSIAQPSAATRPDGQKSTRSATHSAEFMLGILNLTNGEVLRIPNVVSFALSAWSGRYVGYLYRDESAADVAKKEVDRGRGKVLILQDLHTGATIRVPNVSHFAMNRQGSYVAYAIDHTEAESSAGVGIYVCRLRDGRVSPLLLGGSEHGALTFDGSGEQLAFISDHQGTQAIERDSALFYSRTPFESAQRVAIRSLLGRNVNLFPLSDLEFTAEGNALLFGVTSESDLTSHVSRKPSNLEIWHWKSPGPLPSGHGNDGASAKIYRAIYHISERRAVKLGNEVTPEVLVTGNAHVAIGIDRRSFGLEATWGENIVDIYLIDTRSGRSRLLRRIYAEKMSRPFGASVALSPKGRYLIYFEKGRGYSYDLMNQRVVDLTSMLTSPAQLAPSHYHFTEVQPPEIAGWTPDERYLLLYNGNDIWRTDPSGGAPAANLSLGVNAHENIRFRLWAKEPTRHNFGLPNSDDLIVDPQRPLLMTAFDLNTQDSGIWATRLETDAAPQKLLMTSKRVKLLARAEQADQYLLTQETFTDFPDLWAGSQLDQLTRISDANSQQSEYRWGNVEEVEFSSRAGVHLKGLLYKPEDFRGSTRYPMIVYIYGVAPGTDLHRYFSPQPNDGLLINNVSSFVSKGYLVFFPQILVMPPHPAQSAVASVLPAVQTLIGRGFVDTNRIGLTGHSFGAYEANFIITQTDLFRCAVTSAGMSNAISAYSMGFGPRLFERGLARFMVSIWKDPFVYLANSPLLYADQVKTPFLIMDNDEEDIMPGQGMEFFIALRRNGREAYLLNYRGEGHNLVDYENLLDWDGRTQQFFDHFLKGAPRPNWMWRHE